MTQQGNRVREPDDLPKGASPPNTMAGLTRRGLALAMGLNIVYTLINAYLGLNFGFGLGFGIITVLAAYALFRSRRNGTSRQEITTTMVASTGFAVYYTLSVSIYIQAYVPGANLPWWLVPSFDVLNPATGSPFNPAWIVPILFHVGFVLASTMLGFLVALLVSDMVLSRKKATFPFYTASGVTINTCIDAGKRSRFMFKWLGIGVVLTFIQYWINSVVVASGLSAIDWDFTPLLPPGFALGFVLNISLMAVAFIIDPKVSTTMLFAGIATYLVIAPLLTVFGPVALGVTGMDVYFNLLFQFTLSPALGVMLLSSLILFLVTKLRTKLRSGKAQPVPAPASDSADALGFGDYARAYFSSLVRRPKLAAGYLGVIAAFLFLVVGLNIFFPFPLWLGVALVLILLVPVALIDVFIMLKFVGEAGIGIGAQRLAFYEIPLATIGASGYPPFLAYPAINPFTTADVVGNLKISDITGTSKRDLLVAQVLKILPGSVVSVVFVLAVWYLVGFPSDTFPAVGVLQGFAIVSLFATRTVGTGFNLVTFLLGGTISGLLAAFLPIAPLGIALAMFLPPSYFLPFSLGGFLRLYTQHKYGKEWFKERGQVIAVGFIAGAAITQVIVSFLSTALQTLILPIGIVILAGALLVWGRERGLAKLDQPNEIRSDNEPSKKTIGGD